MGLRDWVSEMGVPTKAAPPAPLSFNGAPRLGLGDGPLVAAYLNWVLSLQWGSETGSRRWLIFGHPVLFGKSGFNGAPRLGLGDGPRSRAGASRPGRLQWGSETGSRRWADGSVGAGRGDEGASMGLRDWVSEMGAAAGTCTVLKGACFNGAPRLGLGDGQVAAVEAHVVQLASMGLRDWVSEMGHDLREVAVGALASMGLRDWVSEMASVEMS